jgi:hypothetical protein
MDYRKRLIDSIRRRMWWHVPPTDRAAYLKRGKFYASSFDEALFYGRPLDIPDRVVVTNPIFGDSDAVHLQLTGQPEPFGAAEDVSYKQIIQRDALWMRVAKANGFDSIVIFSDAGFRKFRATGVVPRSLELNIFNPSCGRPITQAASLSAPAC